MLYRFAEDIKPMVKFYANGLTSNDGYYVSNTISAVSNLLRHSSFFVKELIATGVSRLLIEVALKSDGGQ